jgi:hypothetical protein
VAKAAKLSLSQGLIQSLCIVVHTVQHRTSSRTSLLHQPAGRNRSRRSWYLPEVAFRRRTRIMGGGRASIRAVLMVAWRMQEGHANAIHNESQTNQLFDGANSML